MSKAPEKMIKRQVVMADGRYLIFYHLCAFAIVPHLHNLLIAFPKPKLVSPLRKN